MYNSHTLTPWEVSRSGLQQALRACEVAAQWPLALHLVKQGHGGGGYGMAALVAGGVLQYSLGWCGFSSGIDVWNMLIQSWTEIAIPLSSAYCLALLNFVAVILEGLFSYFPHRHLKWFSLRWTLFSNFSDCQNARYVFQVASGSVPCICRWKIRFPMVDWMRPSPRLCESPVAGAF